MSGVKGGEWLEKDLVAAAAPVLKRGKLVLHSDVYGAQAADGGEAQVQGLQRLPAHTRCCYTTLPARTRASMGWRGQWRGQGAHAVKAVVNSGHAAAAYEERDADVVELDEQSGC